MRFKRGAAREEGTALKEEHTSLAVDCTLPVFLQRKSVRSGVPLKRRYASLHQGLEDFFEVKIEAGQNRIAADVCRFLDFLR